MRLHSLHLVNFRQHADTFIEFTSGLTGIIGPNGSGKSTLLEAIAWALYGNSAARGTRDTIRRLGAEESRVQVKVELQFDLNGHRFRIARSLSNAECFLDGSAEPVASTVKGVSEFMQRRLGMTRTEFFHTYFTGQKELDVMSTLSPLERVRFLSRVLGYDRVGTAQELVRERRKAISAELAGMRHGMADADAVKKDLTEATEHLKTATDQLVVGEEALKRARNEASLLEPGWKEAQQVRERLQALETDRRVAVADLSARTGDEERLRRDLDSIASSRASLTPLRDEMKSLQHVASALEQMDRLASAEQSRASWLATLKRDREEEARLQERVKQLSQASGLKSETAEKLSGLRDRLLVVEQSLESTRTEWTRDRQEVETKLEALRAQYTDLSEQRSLLESLGPDSPCPTCGRPLGESHSGVLEQVREQLETVRIDGQYYKQRSEQLAVIPPSLVALEDTRKELQSEIQQAERRLSRIESAIAEERLLIENGKTVAERIAAALEQLSVLPEGYDAGQHSLLRQQLARLKELEKAVVRLDAQLEREAGLHTELDGVRSAAEIVRGRINELNQRISEAEQVAGSTEFSVIRTRYEQALDALHRSELAVTAARGVEAQARSRLDGAVRAELELSERQKAAELLENDFRMHDELDRAFAEIRADLIAGMRPELAETASGLLSELTDGRYKQLEFDDDYRLLVLEDEVRKPVLSGGEEDLCNLVLRLAISQMIAERAGQAFSLLILDEVFGSLDENRRASVVDLLRNLNDRFEQVIVITHIGQVREGLDQVIQVRYDEARRTSEVATIP